MAVYVTSDLHGLLPEQLQQLLVKAGFSNEDWLYILGDAIDRQNDGGVRLLCWLLEQPNVQLLLGNHEAALLSCAFVFDEITNESIAAFTPERMELLLNYTQNGGDVTLAALKALNDRAPETVADILDYLREAPLYETVTASGRDCLLVHAGLAHFSKEKPLSAYTPEQFLFTSPRLSDDYFDEVLTVCGHTPTMAYGLEHSGKMLRTRTWIDIDVGVPFGNPPALLRLDDLEEFYL